MAHSPDGSDDGPEELSPEQLHELTELEKRLDIEDPALAELMRRANPAKRPRRAWSVVLTVGCGLVLVALAQLVGGFVAAVATGVAVTLTGYFWVRNRMA